MSGVEKRELDWELLEQPEHLHLQKFVKELNHLYTRYPAMYELDDQTDGFEWINANDAYRNIFSFVRHGRSGRNNLLFVINFSPMERTDYRVGVPKKKKYTLILDGDEERFRRERKRKNRRFIWRKRRNVTAGTSPSPMKLSPYGIAVFKF